MDPLTSILTAVGLALGVVGTIALVAWRYGRSRARVPAFILAAAVLVMAAPPLLEFAGQAIDSPPDAAGAGHADDAVVHPDELERR